MPPHKGQILIAEMALTGDFSFSRSVILLTEHNQDGSVGFILNKKIDLTLSDLFAGIKDTFPIYKGGPVDADNLYYIHRSPELIPDSVEIVEGIFWGGHFESLYEELKKGAISPDDIRFFLGYSGWALGQLEYEIEANSWIVCEKHFDIFSKDVSSIWKEELEKLGGDYLIWANSPENPNFN